MANISTISSREITLWWQQGNACAKALQLVDREKRTLWDAHSALLKTENEEFMRITLPRQYKRFLVRSSLEKNGGDSRCRRIESTVINGDDTKYGCCFCFFPQNDREEKFVDYSSHEISLSHELKLTTSAGDPRKILAPAGVKLPFKTGFRIRPEKEKRASKKSTAKRKKVNGGDYAVTLGNRDLMTLIPLSAGKNNVSIDAHDDKGYPQLQISMAANIWGGEMVVSAMFNLQRPFDLI